MKRREILGFHGVVVLTDRLEEDARRWSKALGVGILRRSARAITLGTGPEFFFELRLARAGAKAGPSEVHVAVRGLERSGRETDSLGGVTRTRVVGGARLVLREFVGPAASAWRPERRRSRGRP